MKTLIFSLFVVSACSACSLQPSRQARIQLHLEDRSSYSLFDGASFLSYPSSPLGFDCLVLNVMGAGIGDSLEGGSQPSASVLSALDDGKYCETYAGVTSSFIKPVDGASLEVTVPTGTDRFVQVMGMMLIGDDACPSANFVDYVNTHGEEVEDSISSAVQIGIKKLDIFSDTTVSIQSAYDSSNPKEMNDCECTGPTCGSFPVSQWYDAGSLGIADGATILSLTSHQGYGPTLTGAGAPTLSYSSGLYGFRGVIEMVGTADRYNGPSTLSYQTNGFTAFFVGNADSTGVSQTFLGVSGGAFSGADDFFTLGVTTGPSFEVRLQNAGETTPVHTITSTADALPHVHVVQGSIDNNFRYYVDGVLVGTVSGLGWPSNSLDLDTNVWIGAKGDGVGHLDGKVGEVLLFDTEISDSLRADIECDLAERWSLTITGHSCQ